MGGWGRRVLKLKKQSKKKEETTQRAKGSKEFDRFEELEKQKTKNKQTKTNTTKRINKTGVRR